MNHVSKFVGICSFYPFHKEIPGTTHDEDISNVLNDYKTSINLSCKNDDGIWIDVAPSMTGEMNDFDICSFLFKHHKTINLEL